MEAIEIKTTPVSRKFNDNVIELYPDKEHEFLMTTKQVAKGFGCCENTIRNAKKEHIDELIEGKHLITSTVRNSDARGNAANLRSKALFWTKRGIVRLGFFIRSERAKQFRDWAEDLIIDTIDKKRPGRKALGKKLEITAEELPEALKEKKYISESRLLNIGHSLAHSITMQTWQTPGAKLKPAGFKIPVPREIMVGVSIMYKEPLYDLEDFKRYVLYFIENAKFGEDYPFR